jgi:mono/diheme cytochrome c family protein
MESLIHRAGQSRKRLVAASWVGGGKSAAERRITNRVRTSVHNRRVAQAAAVAVAVGVALSTTACGGSGQGALHDRGRQLFVNNCGSCHTLTEAGTGGTVGPDLDAFFAGKRRDDIEPLVRDQIDSGRGAMPAGILTDGDADAVAAYVASAVR